MQEIEALAAGMKPILLEHNGCFTGMSLLAAKVIYQKIVSMF
jgi:hypothetical protein